MEDTEEKKLATLKEEPLKKNFEDYKLLETLGNGGFGKVKLA